MMSDILGRIEALPAEKRESLIRQLRRQRGTVDSAPGHYDVAFHPDALGRADIVTLGKTMSDMTLPTAVVVSEDVYTRARARAPARIARLSTEFRNNLSARISLHALESVDDPDQLARHQAAYAALVSSLNATFRASKVFGDVAGSSTNLMLTPSPLLSRADKNGLVEILLSALVYRRCHVFMFALRMMHRVAADPADLTELARDSR